MTKASLPLTWNACVISVFNALFYLSQACSGGGLVSGIYTTQYHIHYVKETLLVYVLELHFYSEITTQQRPSALIRSGLNPFLLLTITNDYELECVEVDLTASCGWHRPFIFCSSQVKLCFRYTSGPTNCQTRSKQGTIRIKIQSWLCRVDCFLVNPILL